MKVMVVIKVSGADEDKIAPTREMVAEMEVYNEKLIKAGIMLDGGGLSRAPRGRRSSSREARRRSSTARSPSPRRSSPLLGLAGQLPGGGRRVGPAVPRQPRQRDAGGPGGAPVLRG
ncbi:hypothetical protein ACFQX6_07745 [Streptosporangium lutulentum]